MSTTKTCAWCGKSLGANPHFNRKYCNPSCRQRAYEARKYGAYNAIRDALEAMPSNCYLCEEPLDPDVKSGPMAPTADHTIPVSKGGSHDLSNIVIIHAKCNSAKLAKIIF